MPALIFKQVTLQGVYIYVKNTWFQNTQSLLNESLLKIAVIKFLQP
ncbi:hypothetical protein AM1_1227 [Acaryochloris marina MBIC11017]|uniref:Uncharacterized protein n=1 Tax=Acaryochloris marina (strain MBIC 11017) TaxID=329726 RepID=B0C404_ACAM1|nr:hypothetical protein AM1_1227 [Acaryochloris marina MBIC11017]